MEISSQLLKFWQCQQNNPGAISDTARWCLLSVQELFLLWDTSNQGWLVLTTSSQYWLESHWAVELFLPSSTSWSNTCTNLQRSRFKLIWKPEEFISLNWENKVLTTEASWTPTLYMLVALLLQYVHDHWSPISPPLLSLASDLNWILPFPAHL